MYKVTINLVSGRKIIHTSLSKDDVGVFKRLLQKALYHELIWFNYVNKNGTMTDLNLSNITHIQWPNLEEPKS